MGAPPPDRPHPALTVFAELRRYVPLQDDRPERLRGEPCRCSWDVEGRLALLRPCWMHRTEPTPVTPLLVDAGWREVRASSVPYLRRHVDVVRVMNDAAFVRVAVACIVEAKESAKYLDGSNLKRPGELLRVRWVRLFRDLDTDPDVERAVLSIMALSGGMPWAARDAVAAWAVGRYGRGNGEEATDGA